MAVETINLFGLIPAARRRGLRAPAHAERPVTAFPGVHHEDHIAD